MTRINALGASRRLPPRLTLLSSNTKYKFKEERKRILKLSVKKLRSIEDPEAFLSRSVLINNTLKRLQSEVREEKVHAKKTLDTYSPSPYSFCSIEKAYREEMERLDNNGNTEQNSTSSFQLQGNDMASQPNHDEEHMFEADDEDSDTSESSRSSTESSSSDEESESSSESMTPAAATAASSTTTAAEEEEEDAMQQAQVTSPSVEDDLLSEVYMPTPSMPPPPQMIASLDEDDLSITSKRTIRPSTPVPWDLTPNSATATPTEAVIKGSSSSTAESCDNEDDSIWRSEAVRTECWTKNDQASAVRTTLASSSTVNTWQSNPEWPTYTPSSDTSASTASSFSPNISAPMCSTSSHKENLFQQNQQNQDKCYSCGQSSLFQSELQSVVFNSLIASLETWRKSAHFATGNEHQNNKRHDIQTGIF